MFDGLAARLRHLTTNIAVKRHIKRERIGELSLSQCWQDVSHCVVCWPESGMDVVAAECVFTRLRERFPWAVLTAIALPGGIASPPDIGVKVLQIRPYHFNILGLPRKRLKEKLKRLKADVAVDLSPEYNPLSAYCCCLSGAKLRIGFKIPQGDSVFNFQIAPRKERTGKERYMVLAKYIG